MNIKAVIFDLDGTLLDSLEDIAFSMNRILAEHHFPTYELMDYKSFIGEGIRNLVKKALPESHKDEENVSKFLDLMLDMYGKHCMDKTKPYAGVVELLEELTKKNIPITILSNKADELTQRIVPSIFSNYSFSYIMGFRPDIPRKPDPTGAELIRERLDIPASQCLFVGDTGIDMQTANAAGMYAVGVLWGYRSKDDLVSNKAHTIISHPLELLKLLDS